MMRRWCLAWGLAMVFGVAQAARAEVLLFAPGGPAEALEQAAKAAAAQGIAIKVASGHSPAQARQIVEGAPADIFVSADPQWMDFLAARNLLSGGKAVTLASTRLVMVAAPDSAFRYEGRPGESLAAALGGERLAIGDPDTLPSGRFARMALTRLGAWDGVAGQLAVLPHVRGVVAMVERGEVPAGIGFAFDVAGGRKVRVVTTFPESVVPAIVFPMAVVAGHERDEVIQARDFLAGPQAAAIFRANGFETP